MIVHPAHIPYDVKRNWKIQDPNWVYLVYWRVANQGARWSGPYRAERHRVSFGVECMVMRLPKHEPPSDVRWWTQDELNRHMAGRHRVEIPVGMDFPTADDYEYLLGYQNRCVISGPYAHPLMEMGRDDFLGDLWAGRKFDFKLYGISH